jgi:RimJ/RimL family protein N-acetyltransferase
MTAYVETPRLILRSWRESDAASFIAMGQDPLVMRHFPQLMEPAETRAYIDGQNAYIAEHGHGGFAIERKDTGAFAGVCGCKALTWPHRFPTNVEIGWRFHPSAWGQGFATEAARAALAHCFSVTDLDMIVSFTVLANKPSWSVMERLGMTRRADLDFDHPRVPDGSPLKAHIVYALSRPS